MQNGGPPLEVKVWGDLACFTRPEMKAERVSYPVMTPSAARGVLEAIFWKPEFRWEIREIWVLNEIRHFSILRNEVNTKAAQSTAKGWMKKGGGYYAEEDRAQRHTLGLRDVSYLVKADVVLRSHTKDDIAKYRDQFRRRVNQGQSYHQPYFGCREFAAHFGPPTESERPIPVSDDLGLILFDLDFDPTPNGSILSPQRNAEGQREMVRGKATPRFFQARLDQGVLRIPRELYDRRS